MTRETSLSALRFRALPCAMAAALAATPSHALMLGEPEVRSYLGRPLDVRIPVQGAGADAVDASCFELLGDARDGVATLTRAQLEVEQQGGATYLRVRSSAPIAEPATMLRLRAACPPSSGALVRQYGILLDPMPASTPSAPLVAISTPPTPSVAAVQAAQATAPVAQAESAPVKVAPAHAPHKAKTRHHATRSAHVQHRAAGVTAVTAHAAGGFHLKLSGPVLDLAPTLHVSEAERERLREARALLDGDDYASAMLALRDRIESLQKHLEVLQAQAARIEAAERAGPSAALSRPTVAPSASHPQPTVVPAAAFPREPSAALRLADGAWSWALVALLGLAALLLPGRRWARRTKPAEAPELVIPPRKRDIATETGRFAPPPPQVLVPEPGAATPGTMRTDDTEESIRAARELYNAGERLQAAGVLRLAIESHPERVAPWLPLFDLLMRERLATEYGELARGFHALHGSSPAWKTVQRAGRQLEPSNPLYADAEERQAAA